MKTLAFRSALVLLGMLYLASAVLACWPFATPIAEPHDMEIRAAQQEKLRAAAIYRQRFAAALVAFNPAQKNQRAAFVLLQEMNDPAAGNSCDTQRVGVWGLGLTAHAFTHYEPDAPDHNYAIVLLTNGSSEVVDVLLPRTESPRVFRSATLDDVDKDYKSEVVLRFEGTAGVEFVVYRATENGFLKAE